MSLPGQGDPLKLADGRLVYPGGRIVDPNAKKQGVQYVEVPTNAEAQRLVVSARRKLSDLPEMPKAMNAVSALLSYSLFGLADDEIALATGLSVDQVGRIKTSDAYTQMHRSVVQTVLASETDVVRDLLAKNAKNAASVMVDALETGSRSDRINAAKDILDRSGHRPTDVVEHRHRMDGGLVIEIVKRGDASLAPVIDMEGV
jgi:hypothetical protein